MPRVRTLRDRTRRGTEADFSLQLRPRDLDALSGSTVYHWWAGGP